MASISSVRRFAEQSLEGDLKEICGQIISEVQRRRSDSEPPRWTFSSFAKFVGRPASDEVLQQCVLLLSGGSDRRLLDMHFLYFDPNSKDGVGEEVEDEEVNHAYATGYLIDPVTGAQVENFEEYLAPFFVPSSGLRDE